MLYNIGGLWLHFAGENPYFEERGKAFRKDPSERKPEECDICVSMRPLKRLRKPVGIEEENGKDTVLLRKKPPLEGYYIFSPPRSTKIGKLGWSPVTLDINSDWSDVKLKYVRDDSLSVLKDDGTLINMNQMNTFLSTGLAFRYMLIRKNSILIHSSSIEFEGKGVIFSAPSGTGKSTHVRLWEEMFKDKVTIINEDRPAIRYMNNIPMLCGTPWSGTSDSFANKIVPLNSIVMLEQSPFNSIERLSSAKALQLLMPRCFLPYFDSFLMSSALDTIEKLIQDVPVYLLKCRPEYEAVELVQKCLI